MLGDKALPTKLYALVCALLKILVSNPFKKLTEYKELIHQETNYLLPLFHERSQFMILFIPHPSFLSVLSAMNTFKG